MVLRKDIQQLVSWMLNLGRWRYLKMLNQSVKMTSSRRPGVRTPKPSFRLHLCSTFWKVRKNISRKDDEMSLSADHKPGHACSPPKGRIRIDCVGFKKTDLAIQCWIHSTPPAPPWPRAKALRLGLVIKEPGHGEGACEGLHTLPQVGDPGHCFGVLQQVGPEVLQLRWSGGDMKTWELFRLLSDVQLFTCTAIPVPCPLTSF